jgi:hypothetical protein
MLILGTYQKDLAAAASKVRASTKGITVVSDAGSDATPPAGIKRGRGRPKKVMDLSPGLNIEEVVQVVPEMEPEPPAKKPRGRPRKTVTGAEVEIQVEVVGPTPTRGKGRKSGMHGATDGEDGITGDEATPVSRRLLLHDHF